MEGDLVLAKMKGSPKWPGRKCTPNTDLSKSAPKPRGPCTWIYFYGTKNYSWIKNTDLEPYVEHRDAYVKIIKNPSLKEAVKEADEHLRDLQSEPTRQSGITNSQTKKPAGQIGITNTQPQILQNIVTSSKIFGFLGVGVMGSGIVKNLLNSGHKVIIWNRDPSKSGKWKQMGAKIGKTPCDVAEQGDIIFSCVSDPLASKELVFGNGGILSSNESFDGKGYVEMTGLDGDTSQILANAIASKGGRYLEAQMQGSRIQAEEGTLVILTAGDRSLFEECHSCFQAMGKNSIYLGGVGNASKMYLVLQLLAGVTLGGLTESLALADRVGLPTENVLEVLRLTTMSSTYINEKAQAMIDQAYHPADHPLTHMQKDLRLGLSLSEQIRLDLPITAATNEVFKRADQN